jgi:hypothetical protein
MKKKNLYNPYQENLFPNKDFWIYKPKQIKKVQTVSKHTEPVDEYEIEIDLTIPAIILIAILTFFFI